jgi:hypothetical protein
LLFFIIFYFRRTFEGKQKESNCRTLERELHGNWMRNLDSMAKNWRPIQLRVQSHDYYIKAKGSQREGGCSYNWEKRNVTYSWRIDAAARLKKGPSCKTERTSGT